jgi:hypothetical protein
VLAGVLPPNRLAEPDVVEAPIGLAVGVGGPKPRPVRSCRGDDPAGERRHDGPSQRGRGADQLSVADPDRRRAGGGAAGGAAVMMGLHIFVRDLLTGTWVLEDPMRWADAYPGRIATALAVFIGTGGGTLQLTGTAEAGRVTVINTAGMAVADVGWMTMSDTELAQAGIPLSGG